jgi:hypothetical protein
MGKAGLVGAALAVMAVATAHASPVSVRFQEGVTRGFPVLRSVVDNETLAQGDLVQVARGDRVTSRLLFRFKDGSIHDETVVFLQRDVFTLLSYRLIQKGPSFPETLECGRAPLLHGSHLAHRPELS